MTQSRSTLLAALVLAGFVALLLIVPRLVPPDPSVFSAAAAEGYHSALAHPVALGWAVIGIVAALLAARSRWLAPPDEAPASAAGFETRGRTLELVIVAAVVVLLLWPPFLARYGPYVEDKIFLNATHRMHGGMVPYRDFEFLYGPLMLYPVYWWQQLTGFSMQHYYGWLAILEAAQYVVLAALLQRLVPQRGARILIFLALAAQLINPLLGINYNGIRRLLPAAALLLLTRDPRSPRVALTSGALVGLSMAYAHDFGIAALVAAGALYAVLLVRAPSLKAAITGASVAGAALVTWLAVTGLLLRGDWPSYIENTRSLVARFSLGEAGFRFYWTVNSLAAFALLALGCVVAGRALAQPRATDWTWGDRFFLAGLFGTLFSLKSGLNRSDVWHLDNAVFLLICAFLLPLPAMLARRARREQVLAAVMIGVLGLTHLIGNAPLAAFHARGWLRGMRDTFTSAPRAACPPRTAAPCTTGERSGAQPGTDSLAAWLAEPSRLGRPVLLYGAVWGIGPLIGVYKGDHLNDDFIYADERGRRAGEWISAQPEGIVVMERAWHDRLFAPAGADTVGREPPFRASLMKTAGEWLASPHYRGVVVERPLFELRWRRTAGLLVKTHFREAAAFGDYVALTRSAPSAGR